MPRRRKIVPRDVRPDFKYNDKLVSKFINSIMLKGKKSIAEGVLYRALDIVADKTKDDPIKIFKQAIENVKPAVEVKSRRVGGSTYQVPIEVRPSRRQALAIRWLLNSVKGRAGKSLAEKLSMELIEAAEGKGAAVKKREDTHRMAEANKAFSHFRW